MEVGKSNSSLLEVDDRIIKKQLLIEGDVPQELNSLFPEALPDVRATTIKPKPGLCVKARDGQQQKVFINVCTCDTIPAPEDISQQELITILESDGPSDFRVPMSIGSPHQEKDKSGEVCVAYDVVISPQFFSKMSDDPLFLNFFMIATMEGLEEKYTLTLNKNNWTILKNKKYHGSISEQMVRTTIPLVQELSGARKWGPHDVPTTPTQAPHTKPLITQLSTKPLTSPQPQKVKPQYSLRKVKDDNGTENLLAEINLPHLVCGRGVEVDVGEDRLVVESPHNLLDVFTPFCLDNDKATAHFITSSRVVLVQVPVSHS